jgi:hypothetical protein
MGENHHFVPSSFTRIFFLIVVLGILLMPGGFITTSTGLADARLSASDKTLLNAQKEWLDPEASIDTEAEAKDPAANNQLTRTTLQTMDAAPKPDSAAALATLSNAAGGRWTTLPAFPKGTNAYHMVMGPQGSGKILLIAGSGNSASVFKAGTFKAYIWNPSKGLLKTIKVPEDMFCSGHMLMSNGEALAAGGTTSYSPWKGETSLYTFNFSTEKFTRQPNMNHGRWYPTVVNSPSGLALIIGGLNAGGVNAGTAEWYNPKSHNTSDTPGKQVFPLYPSVFTTADHRYFYTGQGLSNGQSGKDLHAPGFWTTGSNAFQPVSGLSYPTQRGQGASCRVGDARNQDFIVIGGGWPAIASTNLINLNQPDPAFHEGPALASAKSYISCVELPDGSIVEMHGGTANKIESASREVSLLSSASATSWTHLNPLPSGQHRLYHSTAFLMDDGSIVSFGSNPSGETRSNSVLRYEPPYLFKGPRPTIGKLPAVMNYGKTYSVTVSTNTKYVTITTAPGPTHSTDANQKMVSLPVVNGTITLNFNSLQFGTAYVRVFAMSDKGVPSVAKWSKVQ